ncbi:MAG TPA: YicC/YloC family endoribonuclease, partial [Allocoleopsis sp.]
MTIEVRALNSKMTDIRFRMPMYYKEKEIELRRILTEQAERGKIDVSITIKSMSGEDDFVLNHELFKNYHRELTKLTSELGMNNADMLTAILRLPNVVGADEDSVPEEEWEATQAALADALKDFQKFRSTEGSAMDKDLRDRVSNILELLQAILPYEKERIVKLRQRL